MENGEETRIVSFNVNGLLSFMKRRGYNEQTFPSLLENICTGKDGSRGESSVDKPEIICIQECKMSINEDLNCNIGCPKGYDSYFSLTKNNKRYSGVATYVSNTSILSVIESADGFSWVRKSPRLFDLESNMKDCDISRIDEEISRISDILDYSIEEVDLEGRCMITDHKQFVVLNLYFPLLREMSEEAGVDENCESNLPNNNVDLSRLKYRLAFHEYLFLSLRTIVEYSKRKVLLLGDFNVVLNSIDSYCATLSASAPAKHGEDNRTALTENSKMESISKPLSSSLILKLESSGEIYTQIKEQVLHLISYFNLSDVYRRLHPNEKFKYTCWNQVNQLRCKNQGNRIDLFLLSSDLFESLVSKCEILNHVYGSDHCPVVLYLSNNKVKSMFSSALDNLEKTNPAPSLCSKYLPQCKQRQSSIHSFLLNESGEKKGTVKVVNKCNKKPTKNASVPFCKHNISCKRKTVSKAGKNKGRIYWVCSKSEHDKCDAFIWEDQHNPSKKQDISNFVVLNKKKVTKPLLYH
ncbi:hypothetical protein FG386_001802 [Cryptosporidium ryanae]|uniref:uncharacterized protein n=1 Tax=Cryptosporidium ryanae TaxID=515981 RepID=UPI003519F196|nr:hypothetical protein FG386_001802 [Cryptosporidium ryanae]